MSRRRYRRSDDILSKWSDNEVRDLVNGSYKRARGGGEFVSARVECPVPGCNKRQFHTHHVCPTCKAIDGANGDCGMCRMWKASVELEKSLRRLGKALFDFRVLLGVTTVIVFTIANYHF